MGKSTVKWQKAKSLEELCEAIDKAGAHLETPYTGGHDVWTNTHDTPKKSQVLKQYKTLLSRIQELAESLPDVEYIKHLPLYNDVEE